MKYIKDSADLNWLGAPAFIVIVLFLLLTANRSDGMARSETAEKTTHLSAKQPSTLSPVTQR